MSFSDDMISLITFTGWGQLFKFQTARGTTTSVGSATPAILMVLVAFGLPSKMQFWPFQVIDVVVLNTFIYNLKFSQSFNILKINIFKHEVIGSCTQIVTRIDQLENSATKATLGSYSSTWRRVCFE